MADVAIRIGANGITVDKDPVVIRKHAPPEKISWTIKTPGWKFTGNGIVIHLNLNQFTARGSKHKQEFHWTSRNSRRKTYKYTINVTNGETTTSRDPGIKNGGR
jgi:hypothetical protein